MNKHVYLLSLFALLAFKMNLNKCLYFVYSKESNHGITLVFSLISFYLIVCCFETFAKTFYIEAEVYCLVVLFDF